jgi:hypothetical protein
LVAWLPFQQTARLILLESWKSSERTAQRKPTIEQTAKMEKEKPPDLCEDVLVKTFGSLTLRPQGAED